MAVNFAQWVWIGSVEILLTLVALVVLGVDLAGRGTRSLGARRGVALGLGVAGCLGGVMWLGFAAPEGVVPGGMLTSDGATRWVKAVILILAAGALALSARAEFTLHPGEYVAVLLFGVVGMLLITGAGNLLMLFLSLELASVALYILAGFARRDPRSMEAGLKYFLFGGVSAAFLLFGMSLVYGATGALSFDRIGAVVAGGSPGLVFMVGLVFLLVGFGFKVAAVPFHFWAPDVYEGAPTPVAGLVAGASKVGAFFILAKFAKVALAGVLGSADWGGFVAGWAPLVAWVAAASMVVGNLAALAQTNVKRLLAYSAVAHAGYTLVATVAGGPSSVVTTTFYAITYAFTVLGAFGVVGLVEREAGGSEFRHFVGLSRRSPVLALCFGVFVLSLAGIPPLAGFFAKFYVFLGAFRSPGAGVVPGLLWLVGLGAATTCVSFYYYLRVLKAVFVEEPTAGIAAADPGMGRVERLAVVLAAGVVVVLGCLPALLLGPLERALAAVGAG